MKSFQFGRQSGILLHPTSLPNNQGIGTLGAEARDFLDFACRSGIKLWQVCPLGPTGYGDSPYQCFSAFAGNPLLIDLEALVKEGLLNRDALTSMANLPQDKVDFGAVIPQKIHVLQEAWKQFESRKAIKQSFQNMANRLAAYRKNHRGWLEDYGLFMALKDRFDGKSWNFWPQDIRDRQEAGLKHYRYELKDAIDFHVFIQWLFFEQWTGVKAYAATCGVKILGDMPIFVAYDSADVWTRRDLFQLDDQGLPTAVAGVPPDYFSPTGQLWGNPLYNWEKHKAENFSWWVEVIKEKLKLYDYLRIDHFRGFAAYWAVPFGDPTAQNGKWIPAPGMELFTAIRAALGNAPIIAEDLGLITPDVVDLIKSFGFPGMKVLQFAFDSAEGNDHVPHNYQPHSLVYTGTHDNDTVRGWFLSAREEDRVRTREYLNLREAEKDIHWGFIRAAYATVATIAVIPLQDVLGLDASGRMNTPGSLGNNWGWRYKKNDLKGAMADKLRELARTYGR